MPLCYNEVFAWCTRLIDAKVTPCTLFVVVGSIARLCVGMCRGVPGVDLLHTTVFTLFRNDCHFWNLLTNIDCCCDCVTSGNMQQLVGLLTVED